MSDDTPYVFTPPKLSATTDLVILSDEPPPERRVLLVERRWDPCEGMWALPGGFVEVDEDLDTAARRELLEETGVAVEALRQIGAFGQVDRDPRGRVITIAYLAVIDAEQAQPIAGDDAAKARWWRVAELPELAFDHGEILRRGLALLS